MKNSQNNIKLIIHRGSHLTGGNCVELVSPNTRILIDCGLPWDYDKKGPETQQQIRENAREWLQNCDAIFLSHYHGDHYSLLCEAPVGTKVFTSDETALLLELSGIFGEDLTKRLDIQTFEIDDTITFKDLRVKQYIVDDSAFGANAFLFEEGGRRILYSGAIRTRGRKGIRYEHLPQNMDYLLLEGTNLTQALNQKRERAIEDDFVKQFSANPDSLHLVWCPSHNMDRIYALYRTCLRTNRILCVDPYTAYLLEFAHSVHPKTPIAKRNRSVMNYYPSRFTSMLMEKDETIIRGPYTKMKTLDFNDLSANPSKYAMVFHPKMFNELKDHLEDTKVCLTYSVGSQYLEQNKAEINNLKAWIEEKPEQRKRLPDIHSSGHIDIASLQKVVEHIQPKRIIPVHAELPEMYKTLFPDYTIINTADETPSELPIIE